jgi:hypothetical protein
MQLIWVLIFTVVFAFSASASDGVLEINQTCATSSGCFSGDSAGFPVSINTRGSYLLTSNLMVVDAGLDGIEVHSDDVTIDLNGFTVSGPTRCAGAGTTLVCTPTGLGRGIDAIVNTQLRLLNGTVRGFASTGILTGDRAYVARVMATHNRLGGIDVLNMSIVRDSTSAYNGLNGIDANQGSVVTGNASYSNALDGFLVGRGSSIIGNTSRNNGRNGIWAQQACVVRDNAVSLNEDDGIEAKEGTMVSDNAINQNQAFGLNLLETFANDAAYRDNILEASVGGTVNGGIDLGGNVCEGSIACP